MAASQFTDAALRGYLDAGHSQADAARHFGVSEPAIHQRMKRMRRLTSRVIALEKAGAVVDEKLSATARLERVQRVIDEELGWAVQEARREGGDRGALADVILKLAGEVRQQLGLQLVDLPDARRSAGRQGVSRNGRRGDPRGVARDRPPHCRPAEGTTRVAAERGTAHPHRRLRWRCGVIRSTS